MNSFSSVQLIICLLCTQTMGTPATGAKRVSSKDGRIVGGIETSIEYFPYQVSLQRYGRHFCGASIIHSQAVLTAAHCVDRQKPESILVRAGSADLYQGGTLLRVRSIIAHEEFNLPTFVNNDIALIILEDSLLFSRFVQSIPLMVNEDALEPNSNLFVSGWGTTSPDVIQISTRLRYTVVQEIDHSKCSASYESFTKITPTMLCAGTERGGRDSCQGDSGGPLISLVNGTKKLVGIVSFGISCATSDYPGVYTKVASYEDWIRQHMMKAGNFELS